MKINVNKSMFYLSLIVLMSCQPEPSDQMEDEEISVETNAKAEELPNNSSSPSELYEIAKAEWIYDFESYIAEIDKTLKTHGGAEGKGQKELLEDLEQLKVELNEELINLRTVSFEEWEEYDDEHEDWWKAKRRRYARIVTQLAK